MGQMHRRSLLVGVGTLLVGAAGCDSKVRKNAEAFWEALENDDYAAVEKLGTSTLLDDLTEEKFAFWGLVYRALGKRKKLESTSATFGFGNRELTFSAEFEEGDTNWTFQSGDKSRLNGVSVKGDGWAAANIKAHREILEKLLKAIASGDFSKFKKLLHPKTDAPNETFNKLAALVTALGPLRSIKDREKNFRVVFQNGDLMATIQLRGDKVAELDFTKAD